jgi:hypothetical protein
MSKYGWERGEIKLPSADAVAFRHDLVNFYNNRQIILFAQAQNFYIQLKAQAKGKRNFDYEEAFRSLMTSSYRGYSRVEAFDVDGYDELSDALFPSIQTEKGWMKSKKPKAPKKNQFKHAKLSAKGLPVGHEASIEFKGSMVIWSVAENNHSVDRAHENSIAKHFFKRLADVKWTNRSGGSIVGNDEYNEESREAGRGGNYVTMRFGAEETNFKRTFKLQFRTVNKFQRGF